MAETIVNTPSQAPQNGNNGMGFVLGIIVLIVFVLLLIFYGIPFITANLRQSSPQVNIPSHYDVNVKSSK